MSDETTTAETAAETTSTNETTATTETAAVESKPAETKVADWTEGLDAASKSFVQAKGFKSPAEAMAALRDAAPPDTPDAYEIPVPEGQAPDFAKAVAPLMHKAGLSKAQATALATGWNEMQAAQAAAAAQAEQEAAVAADADAKRQDSALKQEWGNEYTAMKEHARRAAVQFLPGDSEQVKLDFVGEIERKFGYSATMKMWAGIGQLISEHNAKGLGNPPPLPAAKFYDKSNMNP